MSTERGNLASEARGEARRVVLGAIDRLGVKRLAIDSRRVRRGDTFVAFPGTSDDGRRYIPQAIANGAHAVLWEQRGFRWKPAWRVRNQGVTNLRAQVGLIASHVYGEPSARLWTIGVTGTNGKTTCTQWIARALNENGVKSAVIGTLGYGMRGPLRPLINTTPDAVWLHRELAALVRRGATAVSMEVSSIGLDQGRVGGVRFDVAVFTNQTRDHLDYHRTVRRYRRAKARLFEFDSLSHAIVNVDDEFGAELGECLSGRELNVVGYGFSPCSAKGPARVAGSKLVADARGVRFDVSTPWGKAHVTSPVLGRFNASNLLATLAVLLVSGVDLSTAAATLARMRPIAGRMQTLGGGTEPLAVIDYAHTPDALEQVLHALRDLLDRSALSALRSKVKAVSTQRRKGARAKCETSKPKLICVFGCGGERDRGKRPMMGKIAAALADQVVITSDNPRGENPAAIIDDILAGVRLTGKDAAIYADRRQAIRHAISHARRADIVLIAGKGHETYQEIKGVRRAFSDLAQARAALKSWSGPGRAALAEAAA